MSRQYVSVMTRTHEQGDAAIRAASHVRESDARVRRVLEVAGAASLVLAPLLLVIGWALSYDSLGAFLDFAAETPYLRSGRSDTTEQMLRVITDPEASFRFLLLPHYFVYAAMPLSIAAALAFAYLQRRSAPWHAVAGAALATVGVVAFVGVLGAWLSFPAIADVPAEQAEDQLAFLSALTSVKGVLLVSTILSTLVFVGMVVLACGLYADRGVPRWSVGLIIAGNALILAFAGTENWMALGALSMLVGLVPLSARLVHGHTERRPRQEAPV